jgi:pSer/pThr/pTyr-binding forkhead associated (FHA) protein
VADSISRPRINLTVRHTDGGETPRVFRYSFDQEEVLVGRAPGVDVRLPHAAVSLVHVRLLRRRGQLVAQDDGSTNGTRHEGVRLVAGEPVAVIDGSRLQVGPYELVIGDPVSELTGPHDTAAFARQMVLDLLGAGGGGSTCTLEVTHGPQRGARLPIPAGSPPLLIGRGASCGLHLDDADVSREHLELKVQGDSVSVRDLGSKNGLCINGERLEGERLLRDGDELRIGQTVLVFHHPLARYLADLEAEKPPAPDADPDPVEPPGAEPPAPLAPREPDRGRFALVLVVSSALVLVAAAAALVYLLL